MKILLNLAAFLVYTGLYAQQAPQYSQYIFNSMTINPAYTGSKGVIQVNAMYRQQWTGMPGAPTTQTLTVDGATKNDRVGLGLLIINDQIGAGGQYLVFGTTAVKLRVSENAVLSLGMALGVNRQFINGSEVQYRDPSDPNAPVDPAVSQNQEYVTRPDLRAGVYFHNERFYAGLSAENIIYFKDLSVVEPERHYYLTAGYVFDLNENFKIKPSFLLKENFNSPTNVDLNAFLLFYDRIWLGSSYRSAVNILKKPATDATEDLNYRNAVALIVQGYPTQRLRLGYSYDIMLNSLRQLNTHEISVGYMFFKKSQSKMLTPQYF